MTGVGPQILLVGVLVLMNAAFAGTEMAPVTLRESQIRNLELRSATGRVLARLARDPNRFLATIQIGITLAGFLASAAAAVSLAAPLEEPLSFMGRFAEPAAIVVVTLILAYLTLVFGELAPKRVAMQRAERWALLAARPLSVMATVTTPVVWLLSRSTDLAVRLMGGDPSQQREEVTEQELRDMVAAQTSFTDKQRLIIDGAFEISERTVVKVLRPRREVIVLDADAATADALAQLAESGHSRAPVGVGGALDDVVGVVHLRDLLGDGDAPVRTAASDMVAFPEAMGVLDALHEMQVRHVQMALVVDEHGTSTGIITVEDLVEELVGEIYDESDRDVLGARHDDDGSIVIPGGFPIHDLVDIGISDVPEGPYATVAGLILEELGRLPEAPGDTITIGRWAIEVTGVDGHVISEVRLTALPEPDPDFDADADSDDSAQVDTADT